MNILMVGKYFYPVVGGVEIHMQNLARELIKKGHTVEVFTSDRDFVGNRLPSAGEIEGIRVKRFSNQISLFKAIKNCDYDIIHYHLFRVVYIDLAIIAGKISGRPLVFTPHCVYPAQSWGMKLAKIMYDNSLGRLSLAFVDKIVALTDNDRNDILKIGANPDKIEIVPNSIRFENFDILYSGELFKNKYGIDKFLLYVGRVDWNKGLEYVIQAMPELGKLGLKLVIIGEDVGYKTRLDKLIKSMGVERNVVFTGKVSQELLLSAYAACALFILPSFYEGLPTVVLEAMAYRKPVIATRTGGTRYVIKHGYNGFLIEYGHPDNIYGVAREALELDLAAIGENARRDVKANYSWEISAGKIERIYEGLLAGIK
jgi:glycosyltransferase involved in cell wall biosynthesis